MHSVKPPYVCDLGQDVTLGHRYLSLYALQIGTAGNLTWLGAYSTIITPCFLGKSSLHEQAAAVAACCLCLAATRFYITAFRLMQPSANDAAGQQVTTPCMSTTMTGDLCQIAGRHLELL